jgi:hypothetical protein
VAAIAAWGRRLDRERREHLPSARTDKKHDRNNKHQSSEITPIDAPRRPELSAQGIGVVRRFYLRGTILGWLSQTSGIEVNQMTSWQ